MNKLRLFFTNSAIEDLKHIFEDILKVSGNLNITQQYINGIYHMAESKTDFPFSSPKIDSDLLKTNIRRCIFKAYSIFYRVKDQTIQIIRIIPNKTDYLRVLLSEDEKYNKI